MSIKRRHPEEGENAAGQESIHPSRRRRVEYTEQDKKLAALYNDLADDVKTTRLKAAAELVRTVSGDVQRIDGALTRLIRGLCSSRKAARAGFSIALSEVFRLTGELKEKTVDAVDLRVPALTERIVKITSPEATSNSKERRDHLLGRCFAFKSLVQSHVLFQQGVPVAEWEKVLELSCQLASETLWLRRECGLMLHESLLTLSQIKDLDVQYASLVISKLHSHKLARTPEGIAIWISATGSFAGIALPKGVWQDNDPLSPKERTAVAKILRGNSSAQAENGAPEESQGANTGAAQNTPSFAWQVILTQLGNRYKPSKKEKKESDFQKFWIEAVDNGLFSESASTERKALGLQIVSLAVAITPSVLLHCLFSPNIMRCIMNQRAQKDRYLHEAARLPLSQLVGRAKSTLEAVPIFVNSLIGEYGAINFDQLTKTKTVDELLSRADDSGASEIFNFVHEVALRPGTKDDAQAESRRRMIADFFLTLVRKRRPEPFSASDKDRADTLWIPVFSPLVELGYEIAKPGSKGRNTPSPPMSKKSQEVFRTRMMSCLNHILAAKIDEDFLLPFVVANKLHELRKSSRVAFDADETVSDILDKSMKTLAKLAEKEQKKQGSQKASYKAFKLLFSLSVIQVYNEETDVVPVLEDLEVCYKGWKKDEESSSMLVEILLSFISKPSTIYRKLAEQVFTAFATELTADGLQSMLDVLDKKESLAGQQELFDNADDDAEDGAEEDEESDLDDEDASDVEMIDGEDDSDVEAISAGEEDGSASEADEDGSEGSDDEEDEEEADGELNDFEQKLALALGTGKVTGVDGDAGSDSDESDMDDDQMMALEGHLTTIFRERKKMGSKKKDNKDAKETIINFKSRVLDMLLIYVKQAHANVLALDLIMPLLIVIRTTTSRPVGEKASNVLRQYFDTCNKSKELPQLEDTEDLLELLGNIHTEMKANASKQHSNACSRSSLFISKLLVNADAKHYEAVADLYTQLQKEWFLEPKSAIQPSVFTEFVSWSIAMKKR